LQPQLTPLERFTLRLKRIQRWRSGFAFIRFDGVDKVAEVAADVVDGAFWAARIQCLILAKIC